MAFAHWSPPTREAAGFLCTALQRTSNQRSNIDKDEEEALKKLAVHFLSLTEYALGKAEQSDELVEVNCDAEDKITNS